MDTAGPIISRRREPINRHARLALDLALTIRHDGNGGITDDLTDPAGLTAWVRAHPEVRQPADADGGSGGGTGSDAAQPARRGHAADPARRAGRDGGAVDPAGGAGSGATLAEAALRADRGAAAADSMRRADRDGFADDSAGGRNREGFADDPVQRIDPERFPVGTAPQPADADGGNGDRAGFAADAAQLVAVRELRAAVRALFARAVRPGEPSPADAARLMPLPEAVRHLNEAAARTPTVPVLDWPEEAPRPSTRGP